LIVFASIATTIGVGIAAMMLLTALIGDQNEWGLLILVLTVQFVWICLGVLEATLIARWVKHRWDRDLALQGLS
jgi:hypothetical protein